MSPADERIPLSTSGGGVSMSTPGGGPLLVL